MSRKRHLAEEIVNKLREADVLLGQGRTVAQACRQLGVGEQTYYRWRREYGGMKVDQARKFKELERDDEGPLTRRIVALASMYGASTAS
ncbi:transposase [Mucisphaera calidilacus]|uniref:Transposase n=1 Tax=Mucisphaera calidilacus TaxID=2527982 RepID=A0A518BUH1_9BACT|nr:Transposase [Mucisphaera calidilacus]